MPWLRFCSRLAFIFNICFLVAILIRHSPFPGGGGLVSLIIILGYPFAFFFNLLLNIFYGVCLGFKKKWLAGVPGWLMMLNFLLLILELALISGKDI